MTVQIGAVPDHGFENPVGMLADCHRRIERFLRVLCTVAESTPSAPLRDEQQAAIESALHYFNEGGRRHTADEEESLFPRLRRHAPEVLVRLNSLEVDHAYAEQQHALIEELYRRWISAGALTADEGLRLRDAAAKLDVLYREHIRCEEEVIFPLASRLMEPAEVTAMGTEFRQRRQLS